MVSFPLPEGPKEDGFMNSSEAVHFFKTYLPPDLQRYAILLLLGSLVGLLVYGTRLFKN